MKTEAPSRQYRYGSQPTWAIVLGAVRAIGAPATTAEVRAHIKAQIPDFALKNVPPDLSVLSVNCNSRGHHPVNRRPRKTDSGNRYDALFRLGQGQGVRFTLYDPTIHGIWELVNIGDKVLHPKLFRSADSVALEDARRAEEEGGVFDLAADARKRVLADIVRREGQPAFRKALIDAYSGKCAITDCTVLELLEAAHIVPYRGAQTNQIWNGLLLRADLHKLFDLHMLRIDPISRTVHFSDKLKDSEYGHLEGRRLREPIKPEMAPQKAVLEDHEQYCSWAFA